MLYYLKKKNNGSILIVLHNNKSNKQTQTHIISQKHHRDPETHLPQVCRKKQTQKPKMPRSKKEMEDGKSESLIIKWVGDYIYKGVSEETEEENKCE